MGKQENIDGENTKPNQPIEINILGNSDKREDNQDES